ncbi:MAG TPA: TonB-dependent receptor [Terriglobia bacterium]|nr:TonB-dependent receptor [Terriglobia bacterium]
MICSGEHILSHIPDRASLRFASMSLLTTFNRSAARALWLLTSVPVLLVASQTVGIRVNGVVNDPAGHPIAHAFVVLKSMTTSLSMFTDNQGRFEFSGVRSMRGTLSIRAPGFGPVTRSWVSVGQELSVVVVLSISRLAQQVTVTATRTPTLMSQTAESVAVLSHNELESTSALTLDEALNQVPGFTLYLRLGSEWANPTDQGVSLRGAGSNGASRALVLEDGIPINDPFGGWVYWDRVPLVAVQRIEAAEGGASDLYGSDAMGGVINVFTRQATHSEFTFDTSYGNENTPDASFWANLDWRKWGLQVAAEGFQTDGYILVPQDIRGPVDTAAGSNHTNATITLDRQITDRSRVFISGNILGEARKNGTLLQTNRTHLRELSAGWDWQSPRWGEFALRGYGESQMYDQTFSAIAASRQSETLTSLQRVPAQDAGYSAQWTRLWGVRQTWVAGVEGVDVAGTANSLNYTSGKVKTAVGIGGRQDVNGAYVEDLIRLTPRWIMTLNGRFDDWLNFDALSTTRPLAAPGPIAVTNFPERSANAFSPHVSVLRQLTPTTSVYASVYHAFRAPTLNELYRPYRVGNQETLANDNLGAEHLTGGEAGATYAGLHARLQVHGTLFWTEVSDPIANVTLAITPTLITDQRQNLGSTRSRGVELDTGFQLTPSLVVSSGYQFVDATVLSFPADTALQGLWVPEVPRNVFTVQARYVRPSLFTLGIQGRYTGLQYNDDLNEFPLSPAFELNAFVSHPFKHHAEIYGEIENMTDDRFEVARVPYAEIGPPVLFRIGFRFNWGMR